MDFQTYREFLDRTEKYPEVAGVPVLYPAIGLANEAGEFLGKIKKLLRADSQMTPELRKALLSELGDVQWYLGHCAKKLNSSIEEVMQMNMDKIDDRESRGVMRGSGDNR